MKQPSILDHLSVDELSWTPKYLQFCNGILNAIETGKIGKGDLMPSINQLSFELEISRVTVEKGYKYLKRMGVIHSVPSKGYYIINTDLHQKFRIALLFNSLSTFKKIMYKAFVAAAGPNAYVDLYVYDNSLSTFKKLLYSKQDDYTHFVIIPHFTEGGEKAHEVINTIPKEKLVLLDKKIEGVDGKYMAVYENFEKSIYRALEETKEKLAKYHQLKLIFPDKNYYPPGIIRGFSNFCIDFGFGYKIVDDLDREPIASGEAYVTLLEKDLITLIERMVSLDLRIGEDAGILSYNETPVKKIILNGITTISIDFQKMGTMAAELILAGSTQQVEVPYCLIQRNSL